MIIYLDRSDVPDVEHISPTVLQYLIDCAERAAGRYLRLDRYYRGEHDILTKKQDRDDVCVSVNYAKYVVDIALGYFLGEPVKYDANPRRDAQEDGEDTLTAPVEIDLSVLQDCYHRQQIARIDGKIGKGIGIFGESLELCYASTDERPLPRSACIAPQNGILVCDSSVEHKKLFGIVWERRETPAREQYYAVTIYTDQTETSYRSTDLRSAVFHQVGEPQPHYFGAVPMIAYENNDERQGDFEQIIPLIDAYDQLMTNRFTDKKKFVDALLVFYGMTLREGDEALIRNEKLIDGAPLDARVEYIQKTFDESSVQVLADTAVREMHKMTLTVDMSDEKFAGNSSGQALKLKLLTMNLLVKNKIQRMEAGLKERFELYNSWLVNAGRMAPVDVADVDIRFTLSLPINEAEIVQLVTSLQGIVDDQTLLSQLWFIRDPAEAVRLVREQQREKQASYQRSFGLTPRTETDDQTPNPDDELDKK